MRWFAVGVFLLCLSADAIAADAGPDPVVARIGERVIHRSDLDRWMSYGHAGDRGMDAQGSKREAALLRQIVTSWVIAETARAEKFDQRPDVRENRDLLLNNFLTIEYLDKVVAAAVEVPDKDVKRYYNEHRDEFLLPEKVRARHILVRVLRTAPPDERERAREKAEEIRQRAAAGEEFAALAEILSDDAGTRRKGGDTGFFARGSMAPEFEEAAFSLKPGTVSGIVETDFGFHVIKPEARRPPSLQAYDEVREELARRLLIEKRRKAVDAFVERATKEAGMEIDFRAALGPGGDPHIQ